MAHSLDEWAKRAATAQADLLFEVDKLLDLRRRIAVPRNKHADRATVHADASHVDEAEERPVVAPDLDDQATLRHKPLRDILRVLSKVRGNRFRRARNVEVVAEHDLRRDRDRQLNVAAGRASRELERVPRFRPPDFIGLDEGVGERLQTEVEDALQRIRLANATTRSIRDARPSRTGSSD